MVRQKFIRQTANLVGVNQAVIQQEMIHTLSGEMQTGYTGSSTPEISEPHRSKDRSWLK